ncbi:MULTISPECIES: inorganic triphosphatase [unclassified Acinetobacter]|uniref:CYTH domain-containing protein n=1 Tax=unclassified Acinetobacter TaxID=196816 RepID=UPI002934ECD9|nr:MULTISPECIES: CYTH domain-containing protein [unclassified Acinetobacter]WOE32009.1 CYTH domain-containing protein [Acinetobacter sp. SAAs470]WOE37477.1 CYTH domain-containing protein [Acinetobacter sp. SAAs474]
MVEIELKFQIPQTRRHALLKALDPKKSQKIQLKAKYFDTPDWLLSHHKIALRQRLEGVQWIQTLKAAKHNHIERFEHNHTIGENNQTPELDLSIYAQDHEAQQILNSALAQDTTTLSLQFETDIERLYRVIEIDDTQIEICLDIGCVKSQHKQQEIYEIEFELKHGSLTTLLHFCFEWVKKYQLWLDVRSKAELGTLLAMDLAVNPAQLATTFQLIKKDNADQNVRLLIAQQLHHLLPNIAAISAGVAQQSHIDQAEIALEHLYLTTHLFKHWSNGISEKWGYQLQAFKQQFAHLKHFQHMQNTLGTFLQNPNTASQLEKDILYAKEKLGHLVKSTLNVHHFLELLLFSIDQTIEQQNHDLKWYAQSTLQQQYKHIHEALTAASIHHMESLDQLAEYIQQLKFSFPILTSIYDVKNLQKYYKALHDASVAAKEYQILSSSVQYIQQTELEASDWFVLGWLTAKQEIYAERLIEATEQFMISRKFIK